MPHKLLIDVDGDETNVVFIDPKSFSKASSVLYRVGAEVSFFEDKAIAVFYDEIEPCNKLYYKGGGDGR